MLHPQVLVQCAQDAADHATCLKCILVKGALAEAVKHQAVELETSAYRMELEAKASLFCRWQGRRQSAPCHRIADPVTSNVQSLDARALPTHLRDFPEGAARLASILGPYRR